MSQPIAVGSSVEPIDDLDRPAVAALEQDAALVERLLFELRTTIVGQNRMLERILVCQAANPLEAASFCGRSL